MRHPPVCTACGVFMRCKKNGHIVGTPTGRRWDSDRYECSECGASVAILAPEHHKEPLPLNATPIQAGTMLRKDQ